MTINKGDKVLITETAWEGSVATVVEVLNYSNNLRVIRDGDEKGTIGIVVAGEWEPYVPVTHAFKVGDVINPLKHIGGPYKITKVLPTPHYYQLFFSGQDDGNPYEALPGDYELVGDEKPNEAIDALRAIRSRLADNAPVFGHREDILSIIANVRGV